MVDTHLQINMMHWSAVFAHSDDQNRIEWETFLHSSLIKMYLGILWNGFSYDFLDVSVLSVRCPESLPLVNFARWQEGEKAERGIGGGEEWRTDP